MLKMRAVTLIGLSVLVCAVLVVICVQYIDEPVAAYVNQNITFKLPFDAMAAPSLLALPCALIYLTAAAFAHAWGKSRLPYHNLLIRLSLATLAATAAKDELKWLFGRSWPSALFKYNIYAFSPFTDNPNFGGFPSGHTAYISAPLLMFCILKPKYTPVCLTIIALVMAGLVGGGYHYPGDTIAGAFTGLASAAGTAALMKGK